VELLARKLSAALSIASAQVTAPPRTASAALALAPAVMAAACELDPGADACWDDCRLRFRRWCRVSGWDCAGSTALAAGSEAG
jgi:hypothetical protein